MEEFNFNQKQDREHAIQKDLENAQRVFKDFIPDVELNKLEEYKDTKGIPLERLYNKGTNHPDSFTGHFFDFPEKIRQNGELLNYLQKLSKNKIFLDLGCGNSWKIGASIADVVGASAYLGVDKFNVGNSITNIDGKDYFYKTKEISRANDTGENKYGIPQVVWKEDMLEALKEINDNSAVLMFNGIESELFSFMSPQAQIEFFTEIATEIKRVIGESGYIISTNPNMINRRGVFTLIEDSVAKDSDLFSTLKIYRIVNSL